MTPSESHSWPGSHVQLRTPRSLASMRSSKNAEVMSPSLGSAVNHKPLRDEASRQLAQCSPCTPAGYDGRMPSSLQKLTWFCLYQRPVTRHSSGPIGTY